MPSPLKSPAPRKLQDGSGLTGVPPAVTYELCVITEPFISHSISEPEVLRQSTSARPSPEKSLIAATL